MSVLHLVEDASRSADPLVAQLEDWLKALAANVRSSHEVSDATRIDRITVLEKLRSAVAAAQAAECVRFARSQVTEQLAAEVHPSAAGRGIAEQIALACRVSPVSGSRRLNTARAWWFDLPETFALAAGDLREQVAEMVVSETRHLDAASRRRVDAQVVAAGISGLGVTSAAACIRKHAYLTDRQGYVERGRTERRHRRVTLRPAPDTMALLTGYLPVEQGVACYSALRQHADSLVATGDGRTRGQIMADTLVERLTGQARAQDADLELQIVLPIDALMHRTTGGTAQLAGHGPIPVELARQIITDSHGTKLWRRLFTAPSRTSTGSGPVIGGDPRRRRFDGWLGHLIRLRDDTCRDPFCDAPIRHVDHVTPWVAGGATTLPNGRGVCARGNYVREMPGWRVTVVDTGPVGRHTTVTTTPTGHHYLSRAPDPP
ncbi:MAG TPA: DUF222 domain-containing protein [Propionibacteriaceae bacterium]|nr:DUF222 domain-containing protein [Propionibacteriaceae bacterium]